MKISIFLRHFLFVLSLILFISSCAGTEESDDSEDPTITDVSISSDTLSLGDKLFLHYSFKDDTYLSTYKVAIKSAFENLDTTKTVFTSTLVNSFAPDERLSSVRYDTISIPQTQMAEKTRLPIATGKYLMTISVIDRVGKQSHYNDTLVINPVKSE